MCRGTVSGLANRQSLDEGADEFASSTEKCHFEGPLWETAIDVPPPPLNHSHEELVGFLRSASAPRSRAYRGGAVRSPSSKLQFCCCISGPSLSPSVEAVPSKKCPPKARAKRPTKAPCRAVTPCLGKSNSGGGQSSVGSWRRDDHGQGRASWRGPVAAGWFFGAPWNLGTST